MPNIWKQFKDLLPTQSTRIGTVVTDGTASIVSVRTKPSSLWLFSHSSSNFWSKHDVIGFESTATTRSMA
jgi:hypothetical protein